jgi:hypothetical protein
LFAALCFSARIRLLNFALDFVIIYSAYTVCEIYLQLPHFDPKLRLNAVRHTPIMAIHQRGILQPARLQRDAL